MESVLLDVIKRKNEIIPDSNSISAIGQPFAEKMNACINNIMEREKT